MPKFSRTSKARLAECDHHLQLLFNEIIKRRDCTILCGHRGKAEQNAAFKKGLSKYTWPDSKHNFTPSLAVDVVPYNKRVDYDTDNCRLFAGYVLGFADAMNLGGRISVRLKSGADWNNDGNIHDQTFHDLCHFEVIQ